MSLTPAQILALAPDEASAKAAKGLLSPGKWPRLGHDEVSVWGECQGSGSKPYQAIIDLSGPAFKCTCPSRKFPCKHGLALFLLLAQQGNLFSAGNPPAWVTEWLAGRRQREEKKAEKAAAPAAPADPAAAAKREARRLERVAGGVEELSRWLRDQARHGLASLLAQDPPPWANLSARMVDAQAPGLAAWVQRLAEAARPDDLAGLLAVLGRIELLLAAQARLDRLPAATQADVRAAIGLSPDREDVLAAGDTVKDRWQVLGQQAEETNRLWERRVWLRGVESGRNALLLDFSHGSRRFPHSFVTGTTIAASLAFFPGAAPLRALVVDEPRDAGASPFAAEFPSTWAEALDPVSAAWAANPWTPRLPLALRAAVQSTSGGGLGLRDAADRLLPLRAAGSAHWELLAVSGGGPLAFFGEWDGRALRPLAAWDDRLTWTVQP